MKREKLSKAAASGAVALIFLVLGFQAAIFTGNVFRYSKEHRVDTVCVDSGGGSLDFARDDKTGARDDKAGARDDKANDAPDSNDEGQVCEAAIQSKVLSPRNKSCPESESGAVIRDEDGRRMSGEFTGGGAGRQKSDEVIGAGGRRKAGVIEKGIAPGREPNYSDSRRVVAEKIEKAKKQPAELFEFDPNTVSKDDLVRLGFSEKQAQVIENYRAKGGKYNKPRDFAKMYVVDSAMFVRLEPYIHIRKLNLNTADSLALLDLRGIGPYYAHKILEYRARLGGVFTDKNQLLEIDGIDAERLSGFQEAIEIKPARPRFTLWSATKNELAAHPYIGNYAAKGIIRYRTVTDTAAWSLQGLVENGVLKAVDAIRLKYLDIHP